MIVLYILGGILVLLLILLMLVVRISVNYELKPSGESVTVVNAWIGPVRLRLYPKKEKPIRMKDFSPKKFRQLMESESVKKNEPKKKDKQDEKGKSELLPGGFRETVDIIMELVDRFTGHLRCTVKALRLTVSTKDAATTALAYSCADSAVKFLLEALDQKTRLNIKDPEKVAVTADFNGSSMQADLNVVLSIRVVNILRAGSSFLIKYFKHLIGLDNQNSKNTSRNAAERR